jgi:hypothetical protein
MKKIGFLLLLAAVLSGFFFWRAARMPADEEALNTSTELSKAEIAQRIARQELGNRVIEPADKIVVIRDTRTLISDKVMPALKGFLGSLNSLGLSPLDPNLLTNRVVAVDADSNRYCLQCRVVIDGKWVASFSDIPRTDRTTRFTGIDYFGQTGPENPYRAASDGNVAALKAIARSNPMSREQAIDILEAARERLLPLPLSKPDLYTEKYYGYELNRWTADWWRLGADHINQLNVACTITLQANGPTQAVVVVYGDCVSGRMVPTGK